MKIFNTISFLLVTLFTGIQVSTAYDLIESEEHSVSISGFGSLFATSAGEDGLGFYREYNNNPQTKSWAYTTDSNLGLQIDVKNSSSLSASAQMIFRDTFNKGFKESIEWANVKYQPTGNIDFRAGRMGLDIHMLSEYRDVGFAYLWVRPVTEFYTPVIFNHFDGLDISYIEELKLGSMQFKLFYGDTQSTNLQSNGELSTIYSDMYGFSILFESQTLKLKAAFIEGNVEKVESSVISSTLMGLKSIKNFYPPIPFFDQSRAELDALIDVVNPDDAKIRYYSLGLFYDSAIQIQSEISMTKIENWEIVPSTYSAYISLAKSFGNVSPYIIFSTIKLVDDPYQVTAAAGPAQASLQSEFDAGLSDQDTVSLGFRWDVQSNIAIKAQWDHVKINQNRSALWHNTSYLTAPDEVDVFSLGLNFIF